jgi:hypothetical protein
MLSDSRDARENRVDLWGQVTKRRYNPFEAIAHGSEALSELFAFQ